MEIATANSDPAATSATRRKATSQSPGTNTLVSRIDSGVMSTTKIANDRRTMASAHQVSTKAMVNRTHGWLVAAAIAPAAAAPNARGNRAGKRDAHGVSVARFQYHQRTGDQPRPIGFDG